MMGKPQKKNDAQQFWNRYVHYSFDWVLVVLSALAISTAYHGEDRFWIAWTGLVPSFWILYRSTPSRAFRCGAFLSALKCIIIWFWVITVTEYMLKTIWSGIIFLAGLSLFYALFFGVLYALLCHLIQTFNKGKHSRLTALLTGVAGASLWVVFEFLYTNLLTLTGQVMPLGISYTQGAHPVILQIASITGHYGVSFLIILFNMSLAHDLWERRFLITPLATVLVFVCITFGYLRIHLSISPPSDTAVKVAILQGNIPPYEKFDQNKANFLAHRYIELGQLSNRVKPQLIVWTEAAIPWPLREDDDLMTTMLKVTAESGAYHILGTTLEVPGESNTYYNTVLFVHPDGSITSQYNKRHLLTFVEKTIRIPFITPASGTIHPATRRYKPGTISPVLHSPFGRIGVMVCNESLYPASARQSVLQGAKFIVLLANDIWFREDIPIDCHFWVTLFRAVETGRDLLIANNAGNSAIVDAFGRIIMRSPKRIHSCVSGTIYKRTEKTIYVRWGDIFALVCGGISLFTITYSFFYRIRKLAYHQN